MFNEWELTGRARTHLLQIDHPRYAIHREVHEPFKAMQDAAQRDGFALHPFSAFRDYKTQLRIWNRKFAGEKPLYDRNGKARDQSVLSLDERIDCILNWSALPGASRHHWGTEIDVIDLTLVPPGYVVQLLPEETQPGGVFHELHLWLDEHIEQFGFFRPYKAYQGGMYEEPWHLSYKPVATLALDALTLELLEQVIAASSLLGKDAVLRRLPELYERHVRNICES
jgi:LAS superfamily LD-carboxypeptidase LdcB